MTVRPTKEILLKVKVWCASRECQRQADDDNSAKQHRAAQARMIELVCMIGLCVVARRVRRAARLVQSLDFFETGKKPDHRTAHRVVALARIGGNSER